MTKLKQLKLEEGNDLEAITFKSKLCILAWFENKSICLADMSSVRGSRKGKNERKYVMYVMLFPVYTMAIFVFPNVPCVLVCTMSQPYKDN